ncbi:hypothetical protein [Streptomyces sp. NPDC005507]|uniref:hypothetical protein n=1 Tax=Streptomyces sp. NPDC005507 TaxID=3154885 RepID=UPI0033B2D8DB
MTDTAAHVGRLQLPDPSTLTGDQRRGWACALCGGRLYEDRPLPPVEEIRAGMWVSVELWACAPTCEVAQAKERRGPWL